MLGSPLADVLLAVAALPPLALSAYLALLAALAKRTSAPPLRATLRFDVIVPAHDEEAGIAAAVESLLHVDYPRDAFRVVVVADNCSDATSARARAAGAYVLERFEPSRRGKGYALAAAFEHTLGRGTADAVVVVDADTRVSENLLRACTARLAAGEVAVQADYGVRNPRASWRTRLMALAFTLVHGLRSQARERLGLSCGLHGNGMAFSCAILREVPYSAYSIVEDVEYGVRLGEAGHRVAYAGEASVLGEMPAAGRDARSQRARWEAGRAALSRGLALRLVGRGLARRSPLLVDLGAELLVPPLARLVAWIALGLVVSACFGSGVALALFALSTACVTFYVARGAALTGLGFGVLRDLAWAPVYVAWKLVVPGRLPEAWVRTARERSR